MAKDLIMLYIVLFSFWFIYAKKYSYAKNSINYYTEFHPGYVCIFSLFSVGSAYGLVCFLIGLPMLVENISWGFLWFIIVCIASFIMNGFVKLSGGK